MDRVQSGGGIPSMDEIMSDPALRNLYVACVSSNPLTNYSFQSESIWYWNGSIIRCCNTK